MSKSENKERVEVQAHRNHNKSESDIRQACDQIDDTLRQLRERIIPQQPYLLSVPSDVPYSHSSRFSDAWCLGTPFSPDEEQLQYLTFLSHQGEDHTLLKVVGGWADEKGNLLEEEAISPASQSGRTTPVEQPNRKKISLKDYKTKDKTRPNTPTTKAPAQELRKQVMKSEAREHAVKVEEGKKAVKKSGTPDVKLERRDSPKAEKQQLDGGRSAQRPVESRRPDPASPKKRRRLSSDSPKKAEQSVKIEKTKEPEDSKGLPSLLSPTLPARQKERGRKGLPGLLLPDLPPGLEKLLAKADTLPSKEVNAGTRTEPVKKILGNALGQPAGKRLPEKPTSDSSAGRIRSDSQASAKPTVGTPKGQSPALKPSLKTVARPVTPLQNSVSASPKPRQRHVVVLKYGKKNRLRVERLRKLTPRPKRANPLVEEPVAKPPESRPSSTKPGLEAEKVERKRPAETSPERPAKKVKQLETPEKPKAPNITATKSPVAAPAVAKSKPDLATPKKELKSSAMLRVESQDGGDVRTPQGERGVISTPSNMASSSQAKSSPGPSNSVSREDRIGWREMNEKFFALGRTLKHEGTSLGPSPGNERSEKDQALSAILLIEALLCFMINHTAHSQGRPSIDPGWSTILPYYKFVFQATRKHRHLRGLVMQLGAVCRQAIHNYDIEKLGRDPLPFEHCESAPTPGSDGNTRQNDDVEKSKRKYVSFRDQLVLNARELPSAWLDGSRHLSPMLVEKEYPKTWAKRTKDTSRRGFEKLKPDAVGKEYYLPLDINSNAFEATRFSLSFLREWSDKEKIDWKPRIEF